MATFPNPTGGAPLQVANEAEARAQGWTPSMGSYGVNSYPESSGNNPSPSPGSPVNATPTVNAASSQLSSGINSLLGAIASGNKDAFNEAVRQFNTTFGLDQNKFTEAIRQFNENLGLTQAGVTGTYQGQQTQQAQLQAANIAAQQAGLTGQFGGAPTLAAQQQQYAQQLGLINQAATLQANPFRQQQAIGQMSNLLGGQGVAGFSAPNTVAGVGVAGGNNQGGMGYLSQMIQDIRDPSANTASMNSVLQGIPTPNKLNSVEFLRSAPSTQSLVLQGMTERYGIQPEDALNQIKATLPQFTAPTLAGQLRR